MAGDANNQIWLTSVLFDKDVSHALTLCYSLKRQMTTRKVGVISSQKVSAPLRETLYRAFDLFFYLDEDKNVAGLKTEEFVMLFPLSFKSVTTCVYLASTMMVIQNSDEIFDENSESGQYFVWTENEVNMSVFLIRPSLPAFEVLMDSLHTRNTTGCETYLKTWNKNQMKTGPKYLNEKYNYLIKPQSDVFIGNQNGASIVNLKDIPIDAQVENFGLYAQLVLEQRKQIFNDAVEPLINSKSSAITSDYGMSRNIPCGKEPIAIVGMSCRYPAANNLEEFWNLLSSGGDGTGNPPDFRWQRANRLSKTLTDYRNTNAGFLKTSVEDFDAKFFGISPKEMVYLDPQHRLLHELVWEGLEDAALNPRSLEGTDGGVFIGSWTNEYKELMNQAGFDEFYRIYMGNSIGAAAARISHLLGLTGPCLATESGCSSAMVAVHLACKSLQRGESSFALACGVNLILTPFDKDIMPMVLSPDGHCKTFDANADGFARAEGCGVLVLKRLSDAVKDGDNIWALIKGSAMTQEGISKSMGTPTIHCESLAMTKALKDGNTAPEQVSYVETHGTGTPVGDPMEIASIAKAYHSENREEPLLIGSVKTNVGHTESCSGITGIMKVVLSMHHEMIPAHRNFKDLNPAIDLGSIPAEIPLNSVSWPKKKGKPRRAGVSSFGITGTDAHVIIEESPKLPSYVLRTSMDRPMHIMKISAKSEEALDILCENYKNHLLVAKENFKDLAFTANVGRADFPNRMVIIADSNEEAMNCINKKKFITRQTFTEATGKICFLFTGQGSQYPGMGKELYETSPVFRMHFEYCVNILKEKYNIDIPQVLWANNPEVNEVSRTIYSQTSIFCVEYALLKLWESWGVKPDYVLGHSLGEFAAAVCAEILSVEDALKLVAERSRLIDQLPRGKMLVIKADKQVVDSTMRKFAGMNQNKILDYAAINSDEQTVIAGDSDVVIEFSGYCKQVKLKCIVIEATHAFHSKHMDPMLNDYRTVAKTVNNLNGNEHCKYVSGMRGSTIDAMKVDAEYWVQHTSEKVLFKDASKVAVDLGARVFIEIGPQPVLSALIMMNNDLPLVCLPSLKRNEPEWETLLTSLGKSYVNGLEIDWKGVDLFYERKKCRLPTYPFIGKTYWPETVDTEGLPIHPLLGSVIPNASSTKLFQSRFSLRTLDYVKDHAIGENVVFPGAGYLEMCLAAGLATLEGATDSLPSPTRAMKVENLLIEAPLSFDETKATCIQTVVELDSSGNNEESWTNMNINIFQNLETESTKWLSHARAVFSPIPSLEECEISLDVDDFETTIILPSNNEEIVEVYSKMASLGLKFGPKFRSIDTVWRTSASSLLAKVKVPEESGQLPHVIHPVILDAMIQAVIMLSGASAIKKKLHVPIKIGKFVWLAKNESPETYIHSFITEDKTSSSVLLDGNGKPLAIMSSVELIETTVKAIESVLEQQTTSLPDMFEEVWKSTIGPHQFATEIEKASGKFYSDGLKIANENQNKNPPSHIKETLMELDKFVYWNILRGLYECGWKPVEVHQVFLEDELFKELGISNKHREYFGFVMDVLEQEGIIEKSSDSSWKMVAKPPSLEEIMLQLNNSPMVSNLITKFHCTLLFGRLGEALRAILKDEQSALTILFPEEKTHPSVGDYYIEYAEKFASDVVQKAMNNYLEHIKGKIDLDKSIIRVLEVGAGTGFFTHFALEGFSEHEIKFEYTYTDISAAFFPAAEKRFEKHAQHIIFKKLNIEEDPLVQGFTPEYYDYVVNANVIHATKDIQQSLLNLRMLMKPCAQLHFQEMTRVLRPETFAFGLLDGFWRFEDRELRPRHCTLSKSSWEGVLTKTGFQVNGIFSTNEDSHSYICSERTKAPFYQLLGSSKNLNSRKTWIIFHAYSHSLANYIQNKLVATSNREAILVTADIKFEQNLSGNETSFKIRKNSEEDFIHLFDSLQKSKTEIEGIVYCWALNKSETSQDEILQPFFYLSKAVLNTKQRTFPRVYAVTSGVVPVEDNDASHFYSSSIWGFCKSLANEYHGLNVKCIEVTDLRWDEARLAELFSELWNLDKDTMVAFKGNSRLVPKLLQHKPLMNNLSLPKGTDRFQLVLPESRAVADLQFGPLDSSTLKEDEVEVKIKASALNFRDILSIIKPSDDFKDVNTVGFDFAGVIKKVGAGVTKWKVGDRVCGCNVHFTAMPSHLVLNEDLLISLQENVSYCEAATMPAVYITSVLCLLEVAKIKKDDVVLIHAASGGVGLSAIEICKHVGCTIIATAGSSRKQNYLRSLGISHIFHSRNTSFREEILEVTNGRGVDVVLNSLTSEGFKEATLGACAKNARFVEMSKLNIWSNDEVKKMRPDVEYTAVDLSQSTRVEWTQLLNSLKPLLQENIVKPIPFVRFDAVNVREAIHYMQKARHIGKVVCTLPDIKTVGGKMTTDTPMLNDRSTYLITGGLGGIGFVVCQWMLKKGAKHVLLAGRSRPSLEIQRKIDEMNTKGGNVIAVELDVGNFEQCKNLIEKQMGEFKLPPLKGLMHAAGTLADGLIMNQDWGNLSSPFKTKIDGTLHLHELTKTLNLEHFVLFSSMSALLGAPGQCNHSAGNCFEDAFAHFRHSIGLPATTINWGQWGEVGIATEVDIPGIKTLSNLQGLAALEYAMKTQRVQTAVLNVASWPLLGKFYPHLATYLDERIWRKNCSSSASPLIKSNEFWQQYDSASTTEEKVGVLKVQLRNILRFILKLEEHDVIEDNMDMQEMGVDSLMFVEIKNGLQTLLGERLSVNANSLKDCNTINLMANALVLQIEGSQEDVDYKPNLEEVNALIKEDSVLPSHIFPGVESESAKPSAIKTILLTGSAGTLGRYILKELTNLPQIEQVVCLVKPVDGAAADEHLMKALRDAELLQSVNLDKIRVVVGNVAEHYLGMDTDLWEELSSQIDAVFHLAALIQHNEHYIKRDSQVDMRAVNIGGTTNILEFACEKRLKQVYIASSLLAVVTLDNGSVSERWPEAGEYDGVTTLAYPITKFVSERLIKQAVERGIPCKVFRFPYICGDSVSGRSLIENSHLLMRYIFVMKNRIIPSIPIVLPMLPVDTCATASVRIFFDARSEPGVYNLGHCKPSMDQDFLEVAKKFGYDIEIVEISEFFNRMQLSEGEFTGFNAVYDEDTITSAFTSSPSIQKWIISGDSAKDMWWSEKVVRFLPDFFENQKPSMEYVYNDLMFCKKMGGFEKFGL